MFIRVSSATGWQVRGGDREKESAREREREGKEKARRRKGEMETPLIEQMRDRGSELRLIG